MYWLKLSATYFEIKGKVKQAFAGFFSNDILFTSGREDMHYGRKRKRQLHDYQARQWMERSFL
jgi:hypothetical protein